MTLTVPAPVARKQLKKIKPETNYYEHQVTGIRQMAGLNSFLLGDEPGLGKTLQSLTVAAIDFELDAAHRILVVCPVSLKYNWADEVYKHTLFTCMVLEGTPTLRESQIQTFANGDIDILIVNYEQVAPHLTSLNALKFDIAILDEAHAIKNPKAKRTQACLGINAPRYFVLTGSPMLAHANDLWSLLFLIDPVSYPNYWSFVSRFCVFGGYKDKAIIGVKNKDELVAKLDRVMIRRYKRDVLDIPEKQYIPIPVELHPEQRKLYEQAANEMKIELPGTADDMEIGNALTKFLRLKQICGTTATIEGYPDYSFKLDRAVEMIEETAEDRKNWVVWTQFRGVQAAMTARLDGKHPVFILNGDTPKDDRSQVVQRWGATPGAILVAMIQVAGVGLNMTQANSCIFLDRVWAPKINEQAEDRLHRIGASSTQPVQIYNLICRGTVEGRVEEILRTKSKLFQDLVDVSAWKRALIASLKEK